MNQPPKPPQRDSQDMTRRSAYASGGRPANAKPAAGRAHPGSAQRDKGEIDQTVRASGGADAPSKELPFRAPVGAPSYKVRKASIIRAFKKRVTGKPTHAAPSRSWYRVFGNTLFGLVKMVILFVMLTAFIIGGFGGGLLAGYISTAEPLTQVIITPTEEVQTGFIYDKNGGILHKIVGSENIDRINISYADVKHTYIDEAIISIEDERFYTHNGIDIRRIGSAVLSMLANSGNATHGGSTITQQTVKLITGMDQRSTQRKIQEWFSAMDLEKELTKDQIMGIYINLAPMGNNYIGIEAAARNYFGKNAKNLSLVECAFLAGIPKSPSYYNPSSEAGRRNALRRMRIVLGKMHELGHITDKQYQDALNEELVFVAKKTVQSSVDILSYFEEYAIRQVREDLMTRLNYSRDAANNLIYGGGIKIYTTMDPDVQKKLDETFNTIDLFQRYPELHIDEPEKPQASSVIIDNSDGSIAGMAGGFGEKTINLGLNRAVDSQRPPGSSIKPIVIYAPALQARAVLPGSSILATAAQLDPKRPIIWPRGKPVGMMTIRQAVRSSNNPVAIRTLYSISPIIPGTNDMERDYTTPLGYLKLTGIDRMNEGYPSIGVGSLNIGVSTLEMAAAYATFANGGVYREPYAYSRVEDSAGNVILERNVENRVVYTPQVAYMMTDMLKEVVLHGTAASNVRTMAGIDGPITTVGKTGTTDDALDKWFCGSTPYYSAATWYGYDNRLKNTKVPSSEEANAMRIWNDYMGKVHQDLPTATFERPDGITYIKMCTVSGAPANDTCQSTVSDMIPVGQTPPHECVICGVNPIPEPPVVIE